MAELMPENSLPVGVLADRGGRAVGGNNISKADSQKARVVRHAKSTNTKIALVWKNFHRDGVVQYDPVFLTNHLLGFHQQFHGLLAKDICLCSIHPENEIVVSERGKSIDHRTQLDKIVGRYIVSIGFMDFFCQLPTLCFVTQPKKVLRQLELGWSVILL